MSSQRTFPWPHSSNPGETFAGWATESRQLSASAQATLARLTGASGGGCWLPTPTASNTKAVHMRSGGRSPRNFLLFPTPRASDGAHGGPNQRGSKGDLALPAAVHHWPTPTACDWRSGKASAATMAKNSRPLSEVVWATPTVSGNYNRKGVSERSGDGLATQVGGQLSPVWVEWLMGCPLGWTDSRRSATRRFRRWLRLHSASFSNAR